MKFWVQSKERVEENLPIKATKPEFLFKKIMGFQTGKLFDGFLETFCKNYPANINIISSIGICLRFSMLRKTL